MEHDFLHNSSRFSEGSKFESVNLHVTRAYGLWIRHGMNYRETVYLLQNLIKGILWELSLTCSHRHGFKSHPPSSFLEMPSGIRTFFQQQLLVLFSPPYSQKAFLKIKLNDYVCLAFSYSFREKKKIVQSNCINTCGNTLWSWRWCLS